MVIRNPTVKADISQHLCGLPWFCRADSITRAQHVRVVEGARALRARQGYGHVEDAPAAAFAHMPTALDDE
jgi:hypothetical protein